MAYNGNMQTLQSGTIFGIMYQKFSKLSDNIKFNLIFICIFQEEKTPRIGTSIQHCKCSPWLIICKLLMNLYPLYE